MDTNTNGVFSRLGEIGKLPPSSSNLSYRSDCKFPEIAAVRGMHRRAQKSADINLMEPLVPRNPLVRASHLTHGRLSAPVRLSQKEPEQKVERLVAGCIVKICSFSRSSLLQQVLREFRFPYGRRA